MILKKAVSSNRDSLFDRLSMELSFSESSLNNQYRSLFSKNYLNNSPYSITAANPPFLAIFICILSPDFT